MKKRKRLPYLLLFMGLILSIQVLAQQTIKGALKTPAGEPLVGATVTVKGTSRSVMTDANGNFSIDATPGDVLIFTSVGFETREVPATGTAMNETMQIVNASLGEVVVIGYQTIRRRDLTGSTAVINPANSNRISANNVGESIQGLAPGVTVRTGGAPGQGAVIEIRGVASFTDANPLYVIDGMIADANSTVNTNDIASIQVLKDASAAAIYGSRAANGVIIITTKQGREGPARVSFAAKVGVQTLPKKWDLTNNREFAELQKQQYANSGLTPPASVGANFNPAINTDWQDELTRPGYMQDYNVSLSGGSSTSSYLLSGSYFKNEGALVGHSFERFGIRVNSRTQRGRVTIGENLVLTNSNTSGPNEGNAFYDFPQALPIIPVRGAQYVTTDNPEGYGIGTDDAPSFAYNSVAVNELAKRRSNFAKLIGNAYADVKILNWLNYRLNVGLEVSFDYTKVVRKIGVWQRNAAVKPSSIDEIRSRFLNRLLEHTLNFNKRLGEHNINGVIGYSQQHITRDFTSGGRTDLRIFGGNYLTTIGSAGGVATADGRIEADFRTYGYLGRLNYTYGDRYLLTVSGRIDEDSRFGANYRRGFFPSAAASWRISKESFFTVPWINDLKLRVSYGELGIVPLGSWDYTTFINSAPRFVTGPTQIPQNGITQAQLANPDLKWEERVTKNIGVDAAFFNNRLTVSVEAYNSLSKDALLQLPLAGYLGNLQGNPFVNAGSIRNTGIEFSATYRQNSGLIKWDVSANFTTIKNKVEDVGNQGAGVNYIQVGNTRSQIGHELAQWYVIRTAGIFQTQQEVTDYVNKDGIVIQPNAKPGDVKYVDYDGDGDIDENDRTFTGSPWPKLQAGAQFNASYKNFSLNLQLVGVFGYKIYNDVRRMLDSYQRTNFRSDIDPWSTSNTGGADPRLGVEDPDDPSIAENNRTRTDRWLENGSYLRVRNLEVGYALPRGAFGISSIQNARVFISAQNLFTLTKYKGLDPDVVGSGILERGIDNGNWPASRIISVGISCEF